MGGGRLGRFEITNPGLGPVPAARNFLKKIRTRKKYELG